MDKFYNYLVEHNLMDEKMQNRFREEFLQETLEALEHAANSPDPEEQDLSTHVYSD